jgi:hypothetical protein
MQHYLSLLAQDKVLSWLQGGYYICLAFRLLCGLGYANCVSPVGYSHQTHFGVADSPSQLLGSLYFLSSEVNVIVHLQVQYKLVGGNRSLCERLFQFGKAPFAFVPRDQIQLDPPRLVRIRVLVSYLGTE